MRLRHSSGIHIMTVHESAYHDLLLDFFLVTIAPSHLDYSSTTLVDAAQVLLLSARDPGFTKLHVDWWLSWSSTRAPATAGSCGVMDAVILSRSARRLSSSRLKLNECLNATYFCSVGRTSANVCIYIGQRPNICYMH